MLAMRPSRIVALLVLLLTLWTIAFAEDRPVLHGTVVGVVDGDTADIRLESGMIRIRLHAIDAPESAQPDGKAAKAALSQLIFGKAVEVEPFEQDRYDRLVARIWIDGRTSTRRWSSPAMPGRTAAMPTNPRTAPTRKAPAISDAGSGACRPPIGWRLGSGGSASRALETSPIIRAKPSQRV
jgi:hypothetical protein